MSFKNYMHLRTYNFCKHGPYPDVKCTECGAKDWLLQLSYELNEEFFCSACLRELADELDALTPDKETK